MIETLGDQPCHFILVFDNGYFSEFGTFSITDWIGHAPKDLLAKNFGVPVSTFDSFPKAEVYFARGKIPPAVPAVPLQGWKPPPLTHKYSLLSQRPFETFRGGTRMARGRVAVSDLDHDDRGGPRDGGGRATRTALASERRRVAICAQRRVSA